MTRNIHPLPRYRKGTISINDKSVSEIVSSALNLLSGVAVSVDCSRDWSGGMFLKGVLETKGL